MVVVYASDNNYADIMGVSIKSLLTHNVVKRVYCLDNDISNYNKDKLSELCKRHNSEIVFISIKNIHNIIGLNIETEEKWGLAAYARLFVCSLVKEDLEKLIYLDCDTMVRGSLAELWSLDINTYLCAGVMDCLSCFKEEIGFTKEDKYFNSGVMLINFNKWRDENVEQKIIDYITERKGQIYYADQTIVNVVFKNKIKILHPKYNLMAPPLLFDYKNMALMNDYSWYYTEKEMIEAVKNPLIIHFTNGIYVSRPWIKGCTHPYTNEFLSYKKLSPFKDIPLRKDNRKFLVKKIEYLKGVKNKSLIVVRTVQSIKKVKAKFRR